MSFFVESTFVLPFHRRTALSFQVYLYFKCFMDCKTRPEPDVNISPGHVESRFKDVATCSVRWTEVQCELYMFQDLGRFVLYLPVLDEFGHTPWGAVSKVQWFWVHFLLFSFFLLAKTERTVDVISLKSYISWKHSLFPMLISIHTYIIDWLCVRVWCFVGLSNFVWLFIVLIICVVCKLLWNLYLGLWRKGEFEKAMHGNHSGNDYVLFFIYLFIYY